jgi:hypothetical protein
VSAALPALLQVIDPMEPAARFRPTADQARVEAVEGKAGKGIRFAFDEGGKGVFVWTNRTTSGRGWWRRG